MFKIARKAYQYLFIADSSFDFRYYDGIDVNIFTFRI